MPFTPATCSDLFATEYFIRNYTIVLLVIDRNHALTSFELEESDQVLLYKLSSKPAPGIWLCKQPYLVRSALYLFGHSYLSIVPE